MRLQRWFCSDLGREYEDPEVQRYAVGQGTEANLVSSLVEGQVESGATTISTVDARHKPVLDIDMACKLVDTETPGHHHLFIDKEMSWTTYANLLHALADAGIIEEGYCRAALERGASFVSTHPWKGSQ